MKRIAVAIILCAAIRAAIFAQNAPNDGQTAYYQQTGVVRNNVKTAGDNTGQFITFTRKGCYDSDKNGIQAGDGFLAYQGIGNDAHVYEGDTYWGKAYYYFVKDFSKYNVRTTDGLIYVYERTTAPATAITSAKIYRKPAPVSTDTYVIAPHDRTETPAIQPPVNNNNQYNNNQFTWDTTPSQTERPKCTTCGGSGKCKSCGGSGRCQAPGCDRGKQSRISYVAGVAVTTYYNCGVCNGTGNDGLCYGTGKCTTCKGYGTTGRY